MGVEPTSPAWEAGVITVIRRPRAPNYGTVFLETNGADGAPSKRDRMRSGEISPREIVGNAGTDRQPTTLFEG